MNMNKLKPYNIALGGGGMNLAVTEIENQVTFFNALEYHSIILPNTKNEFSLHNKLSKE